MDKKYKADAREGRDQYELDVDRYINEGMAGGYVVPEYNHLHNQAQIEEARKLPKQNEPFPSSDEAE